ncbi:MAG: hypothetical protein ACO1OF_16375 [Adhaeribacter sp.]
MNITLHIPVKPYSLKYLTCHLGAGYKLSKSDAFGLHLRNVLRSPLDKAEYQDYLKRYTNDFQVKVTLKDFEDLRFELTAQGIIEFNNFVEQIIKAELHAFIDYSRIFKIKQAAAITLFRGKYGITDEDIAFDTFKKSYQRYRNKEKKKIQKPLTVFA